MAGLRHFFVELLGTRPDWPENMTAEEEQVMDVHFDYLKRLVAERKVLLAGPCFDPVFGLIILQTETDEEAVAIMDHEPSVTGGLHTYRLHPMRVSLMADY
ncbi:MAG: YciI family protein [candidate division Zixibacteria bacterium]|nr:YciI family protein [candidate division Zixibacteria bacterium]